MKIKWEQHVRVNAESVASLEAWVRRMLQIKDSVVVLLNTGIWYNTRGEYVAALDTLTALLLRLARVWEHHPRAKYLAVVLAETTAQHFATENGYYSKDVYRNTSRDAYCSPIGSTGPDSTRVRPRTLTEASSAQEHSHSSRGAADWRNDVLWNDFVLGEWGRALSSLPHVLLEVLPLAALTRPLADLHLRQGRLDCTHYCYTPMLYQPIYSHLQRLSERLLQLGRQGR